MILFQLTAYCSECGHDFAESAEERDNLDELVDGITSRAEALYHHHVTENRCG